MQILILDDDEQRHHDFHRSLTEHKVTHAWDSSRAIKCLTETKFDIVSLDHDLTPAHYGEHISGIPSDDLSDSGTGVALFMVGLSEDKRPSKVLIHTWNKYGAQRMMGILKAAGYEDVKWRPHTSIAWSPERL